MPRQARLDVPSALHDIMVRGIEDMIQEECRKRKVSEARAAIAYRSKEELRISGAEIARYLGVNTSSINRSLARMDELIEK